MDQAKIIILNTNTHIRKNRYDVFKKVLKTNSWIVPLLIAIICAIAAYFFRNFEENSKNIYWYATFTVVAVICVLISGRMWVNKTYDW